MKKVIAFSIMILILLVPFTGCHQNNSGIDKAYSLSGDNDFIEINNGAIILTSEQEKFIGGDLSFKTDELSGVKNYSTEYYFFMNGIKTSINKDIVTIEGSEDGMSISGDMGSTSGETIFNAEVWDAITETGALHFSLTGTFMNGERFDYSMPIGVKEIF